MSANSIQIVLKDAETEEEYGIRLSPTSAFRAQTDLTFATSLLHAARQARTGVETSEESVANSPPIDETLDNTELDESDEENTRLPDDKGIFRWSEAAIFLLLEEYRIRESAMSSGKISHKKVWGEISTKMLEKGYFVTDKQCMTRINTMKRTYKSIKDHNGRSGNNKRSWKYYANMETLLGEKPYMAPLATISSTGSLTSSRETESPCTSGRSTPLSKEFPRKRKAGDALLQLLQSREAAEERKEKRHKERMALQLQISEKIDKLLDKLSK